MKQSPRINRLKRLAAYYRPQRWHLASDILFAVVGAGISILIPLIIRYITDEVIHWNEYTAIRTVLLLSIVLLMLLLAEVYCSYFVNYYGHLMGARIEYAMRNDIFCHYQKLSFRFYDNQKVGQLMSRVTNDLHDISEMLHHAPEEIVISAIKLVGTLTVLLIIDWRLAAVAFSPVPFLIWFAIRYNRKLALSYAENRVKLAVINENIESNLTSIREVKAYANEDLEIDKFIEDNAFFVDSKQDTYRLMAVYNSILNASTTFIAIAVAVAGTAMFVISSIELNLTDLVLFMLCINNFIKPIKSIVKITEWMHMGLSGYDRFMQIMDIEPEIADRHNACHLDHVRGDIEFIDVSFGYEKEKEIFSGFDLFVPAGEYVALVGASGVGKSTLCSLIPRFYDVTGGCIKIDGKDIRSLSTRSLRQHIGIVQQDTYLFTGTIAENIRFGKPNASFEEVVSAAKKAHAHEFIMALPEGYDTYVGSRGVKLSGGERQRISIARVFLKDPQILILDEATSSLDPKSEKIVQVTMEKLAENRTTFVIAHRLSTVYNANRILVLTKDGIAEQGSHAQLLEKGGIYASLCGNSDSEAACT